MTEGPPVLPGDSLPDVPLSPSSSQHSTATPHTPEQHGHHHLLLLLHFTLSFLMRKLGMKQHEMIKLA